MSKPIVINNQQVQFNFKDNQIFCTSLDVAKVFGKQHKNVLRDIENILNDLREIGTSNDLLNFELSFKVHKIQGFKGRERKCPYYNLTRDGFSLLAMGPNKYLTDLMELIYPNLPQSDYKVSVVITDSPYSKEAKNVFSLNYLVDNRTPKDPKKLQ